MSKTLLFEAQAADGTPFDLRTGRRGFTDAIGWVLEALSEYEAATGVAPGEIIISQDANDALRDNLRDDDSSTEPVTKFMHKPVTIDSSLTGTQMILRTIM